MIDSCLREGSLGSNLNVNYLTDSKIFFSQIDAEIEEKSDGQNQREETKPRSTAHDFRLEKGGKGLSPQSIHPVLSGQDRFTLLGQPLLDLPNLL